MTPNIQFKKGLCLAFAIVLIVFIAPLSITAKVDAYQIVDVSWAETRDVFSVRIAGSSEPNYTMYELFAPQRIVLDIAAGSISPSLVFPFEVSKGPIGMITGRIIEGQNSTIARVEIMLNEELSYFVEKESSDLVVIFSEDSASPERPLELVEKNHVTITDIQVDAFSPEKATVLIYSSGPIGKYELHEELKDETQSARLLIDLPEVKLEDRVIPVALDSPVALIQSHQGIGGGTIVLDSADNNLFAYEIHVSDNYLELSLSAKDFGENNDAEIVALLTGSKAEGSGDFDGDAAFMSLSNVNDNTDPLTDLSSNLNFSGYDEQKISVDFYKIDLHNVFRLIGEISNRNIVVDEAVSGSLTLSMNDVPWDFLLDVVLNLKDLAKEERFNTIVISPKSEEFTWPEAAAATQLEVSVEPITVTKRLQTSKEKIDAKKLIYEANLEESNGKNVRAIALYEQAYQLWPENGDLAKRISVLAMVKLGQNAKAAHYAKIAVQNNPQDFKAALIAAMSLANMEKVNEAKEYFDLAVSGNKPSKHALASYAAFSEQNRSYDAALTMLDQYSIIYGNSLETMVSRARIFDQMGDAIRADEEYRAILLSGFNIPEDLKAYITNRTQ